MKEVKLLLDDEANLLILQATVLDEEGFTMNKVNRMFLLEKVIDLRVKEGD
jgi:hypothetical protein